MHTNQEVLSILERVGALITQSHIVYTSGRHGNSYVHKDALYPHTAETSFVCSCMAEPFSNDVVDVVAGPTIGGVILAQWVAYHLSHTHHATQRDVLAVYAEEETVQGTRVRLFRRGYDALLAGKRVLVVEDVLTTGGSVRMVIDAVRQAGGDVVGVAALCNRGALTAELLAVPRFEPLVTLALESWEATACPLCQQKIPVNTTVGKGKNMQPL